MKKRNWFFGTIVAVAILVVLTGAVISTVISFRPLSFGVSGEWVQFNGQINWAEYRIEYCSGEVCLGNGDILLSVVNENREIRQYTMDGYRLDWDFTAGRAHGPIYAVIAGELVQVGSRDRGKVSWDETCIGDSSEACFLEGETFIIMKRKIFSYYDIRQEAIVEVEGPLDFAEIYVVDEEGYYIPIGTSTLVDGQEELYWYNP